METDQKGWIKVNKYLETTKKDIWAIGDAIGKHMFRHTANYESDIVINNMLRAEGDEDRMRWISMRFPMRSSPYPQVAGVGLKRVRAD